jgi:hypothetical protein
MIKIKLDKQELQCLIEFLQYNNNYNCENYLSILNKSILKSFFIKLQKKSFTEALKFTFKFEVFEAVVLFQLWSETKISITDQQGVRLMQIMNQLHKQFTPIINIWKIKSVQKLSH